MNLSRHRVAVAVAAVAATAAATVTALTVGSPAGAVPGCVTPASFDHSIPAPIGGPAASPTLGSEPLYATIGGDRKVYAVSTNIATPDLEVSPLYCFGGGAVDTPAVTDWDDGIALFVQAPTGRIYQNLVPGGDPAAQGAWSLVPGAPIGGGAPAVARPATNTRLDLFVRGSNNRLYHANRGSFVGGSWSGWENLSGGMTGIASAGPLTGTDLVVVVRAPNGALYYRSGNTGTWTPWTKIPGATSASPALASGFAAGRLDLFVTGTTGGLYQSTFAAGRFGAFRRIDPDLPPGAKLAAAGKDGRMIVYATATEGGETAVGFDQYVPGLGWSGFSLAPYTCDDVCLPEPAPAAAGTAAMGKRTPLR